jgi:hypothetical protein
MGTQIDLVNSFNHRCYDSNESSTDRSPPSKKQSSHCSQALCSPGDPCAKTIGPLYDLSMSDFIPKAAEVKTRGLSPKAQKLQAAREKAAAQAKGGDKSLATASTASVKAKDSFAGSKKTTFQRKAV